MSLPATTNNTSRESPKLYVQVCKTENQHTHVPLQVAENVSRRNNHA